MSELALFSLASDFASMISVISASDSELGANTPVFFLDNFLDESERSLTRARWKNVCFINLANSSLQSLASQFEYLLIAPSKNCVSFGGWFPAIEFLRQYPEYDEVGALQVDSRGARSLALNRISEIYPGAYVLCSLETARYRWKKWGAGAVQDVAGLGGMSIIRANSFRLDHFETEAGTARAVRSVFEGHQNRKAIYSGFIAGEMVSTDASEQRATAVDFPPATYQYWTQNNISEATIVHQGIVRKESSLEVVRFIAITKREAVDGRPIGPLPSPDIFYHDESARMQLGPAFSVGFAKIRALISPNSLAFGGGLSPGERLVLDTLRTIWRSLPSWVKSFVERLFDAFN